MTKKLRRVWNKWGAPVVACVVVWTAFHFVFDFGVSQSFGLALIATGGCLWLQQLTLVASRSQEFVPYRVSIRVKDWRGLLAKYNLLEGDDEFEEICQTAPDDSIFSRGMNWTVLSLNSHGLPHLIWWNDYHRFVAGLPSFEEEIEGLLLPGRSPRNREWSPRLYFGIQHGKGVGYTLSVCVRAEWWKGMGRPGVAVDEDYPTGSAYLSVATLPYGEIGLDYAERGEDRNAELHKLGWIVTDYQDPEICEYRYRAVENDFFCVTQRDCAMD